MSGVYGLNIWLDDCKHYTEKQLTTLRIMEAIQEFQALIKSGENRKFTVEWIRSEEQIKHGMIVGFARFPIGIRHCYLV